MAREDDIQMKRIISDNLKRLMREYRINQRQLAEIAGVSESTAGKWILQKAIPRMGAIQKIADHFGLPKSYILEERPSNLYAVKNEFLYVPVLGRIACGDPILAEENISGYRAEPKDGLPSGDLYYLEAKGNSMEPTIPDGAMVLIRKQPDVETNEIAAVLVNGDTEATLKRVRKQNDVILLMPDNPEYDPIIVNEKNPARIIGKAVRFTRDL